MEGDTVQDKVVIYLSSLINYPPHEQPQSDITVFRADAADGEYTKFMHFPRVGFCAFLKTVYKKYFYEKVKEHSNLPHYDTCPLTPQKYWVKDYPFDANNLRALLKPGFYRAEAFLLHDSVAKTGFHLFGSVTEA